MAQCEFGDAEKMMMMLCRCAFGISNLKLTEKVLSDYETTIDVIRALKETKLQLQSITVDEVSSDHRPSTPKSTPRKLKRRFAGLNTLRHSALLMANYAEDVARKIIFKHVLSEKSEHSV